MRKNVASSFIEKTWDILQIGEYAHVLKWTETGCSFQIISEALLCSEILPMYFKHSNFSSFIRQLNMYNFHKKRTEGNNMEFYHKLFRKDQRQLLVGIKRKPSQAQNVLGDQLIRKYCDGGQQKTKFCVKFKDDCKNTNPLNSSQKEELSIPLQFWRRENKALVSKQFAPNILISSCRLDQKPFQSCQRMKIKKNIILKIPLSSLD